jgi:hypothetical protein
MTRKNMTSRMVSDRMRRMLSIKYANLGVTSILRWKKRHEQF